MLVKLVSICAGLIAALLLPAIRNRENFQFWGKRFGEAWVSIFCAEMLIG